MIGLSGLFHTDNGLEFKNEIFNKVMEYYKVKTVHGRHRCPWIQGQVKIHNQTLKNRISATAYSLNKPNK